MRASEGIHKMRTAFNIRSQPSVMIQIKVKGKDLQNKTDTCLIPSTGKMGEPGKEGDPRTSPRLNGF